MLALRIEPGHLARFPVKEDVSLARTGRKSDIQIRAQRLCFNLKAVLFSVARLTVLTTKRAFSSAARPRSLPPAVSLEDLLIKPQRNLPVQTSSFVVLVVDFLYTSTDDLSDRPLN